MKRQREMSVQRPWGSLTGVHSRSVLNTCTHGVRKPGRQTDRHMSQRGKYAKRLDIFLEGQPSQPSTVRKPSQEGDTIVES